MIAHRLGGQMQQKPPIWTQACCEAEQVEQGATRPTPPCQRSCNALPFSRGGQQAWGRRQGGQSRVNGRVAVVRLARAWILELLG